MGVERNDSPPNAALWSAFRIMKGNESVGALGALDPWVWLFRELLDPGLLGLALSLIGIVHYNSMNQATCLEYQ